MVKHGKLFLRKLVLSSHLHQTMIQIRNQHAALRVGDLEVLTTTNDAIYGILRVCEDEVILVLINLGNETVENVWLAKDESILPEGRYTPVPILGENILPPIETNDYGAIFHLLSTLEFAPYETYIYQLHPHVP